MTDRFYPLGKQSAPDAWKTSYEIQNEMRSFQRSAYPPGYAGHEPGSREKFGFSTPGPDAARLTMSHLTLREDIDIAEPRRNLAVPRMQVTDERKTFRDLDVPEMDRSYKSAIISPSYRSMAKTRSLPTLTQKSPPARLSQLPPAQNRMDDEHFTYFVPRGLNRESSDRLMSRSLPKLYKHPEKKVMLPFAGDGTGFRTSCAGTEWWPAAASLHDEPSSYSSAFQRPSFYRMSPLNMGSNLMRRSMKGSVRLGVEANEEDGFGSIRLGTPTLEERAEKRARFLSESRNPMLDSGPLMQSSSSFPDIKPTPAARFGYMPPGAGRIGAPQVSQDMSDALMAKVLKLYRTMDENSDGSISRAEAIQHFKKFGEVSANAMFNEVDGDQNDSISFEEFLEFWQQVKRSGYDEDDLGQEIDELLAGNVWVDYKDSRDVGYA